MKTWSVFIVSDVFGLNQTAGREEKGKRNLKSFTLYIIIVA